MESVRLVPDVISVLDGIDVPLTGLTLVGTLNYPARIYLAQNFTDVFLFCSQDGNYENFILPPGGFVLLDCGTNKGTPNTAEIPAGYGLWVNPYLTAPTKGIVVLSYWYSG
ncbi:MAG: hypothetical protein KGI54_09670 [Pseudomonadota bacterium]|nr:hypothetical protein [Pseudomonadota bacterium]